MYTMVGNFLTSTWSEGASSLFSSNPISSYAWAQPPWIASASSLVFKFSLELDIPHPVTLWHLSLWECVLRLLYSFAFFARILQTGASHSLHCPLVAALSFSSFLSCWVIASSEARGGQDWKDIAL
eukprot:RCo046172